MLFAAALLLAQTAPQCTATDAALPSTLAGWTTPGDEFAVGKPVVLEAPAGSVTIGFRIDKAGNYGIALDQAGWIDVSAVGASAPLKSVAHGHGPDCSSIRKVVRFALEPGAYRLDLRNLKTAKTKVMLVAP